MQIQSLGWEDPLEEGVAIHYTILAWKILWAEEPCGPQSLGLQGVAYNWSNLAPMHGLETTWKREEKKKKLNPKFIGS